jgi:hypothetical protein
MKSSEQTNYQYLVGLPFTIWVNICHQFGLVKGSGGGTTEQLADTPPVINQQQQDTPNDRLAPLESEEIRAQRLLREARKPLTERLNQLNLNKRSVIPGVTEEEMLRLKKVRLSILGTIANATSVDDLSSVSDDIDRLAQAIEIAKAMGILNQARSELRERFDRLNVPSEAETEDAEEMQRARDEVDRLFGTLELSAKNNTAIMEKLDALVEMRQKILSSIRQKAKSKQKASQFKPVQPTTKLAPKTEAPVRDMTEETGLPRKKIIAYEKKITELGVDKEDAPDELVKICKWTGSDEMVLDIVLGSKACYQAFQTAQDLGILADDILEDAEEAGGLTETNFLDAVKGLKEILQQYDKKPTTTTMEERRQRNLEKKAKQLEEEQEHARRQAELLGETVRQQQRQTRAERVAPYRQITSGNEIARNAFTVALDYFVSNGGAGNISLGGEYSNQEMLDALRAWRTLGTAVAQVAERLENPPIRAASRFTGIQDKRALGKGNVGDTLAKRTRQGNFILYCGNGPGINVHADVG